MPKVSHALAALVAIVALAAGVYALVSGSTDGSASSASGASSDPDARVEAAPAGLGQIPAGARVVVRAVDREATRADGRLYELTAEHGARVAGDLRCKRVHVSPRGPGLCLALSRNGINYDAIVFDRRYRPLRRFAIEGVPDRARVSPDGRFGAFTSFDRNGSQGYFVTSGAFTTYTRIVDMRAGKVLLKLNDLDMRRDGKRFDTVSPQFWGVTFTGGDRFYATLASGDEHYLIAGGVSSGTARVVRSGIECPAISPDGTRLAYKHRLGRSNRWRLHVLDLESGEDVPLAETTSIDDQPEWLGDDLILYSDDEDLFTAAADGSGSAQRVATSATSPAYVPGR